MEDKKINFTYPKGFEEACETLDFLPEEQRAFIAMAMVSMIMMF